MIRAQKIRSPHQQVAQTKSRNPHIKAFKWREAMPQLDESTNRVLGKFRLKCLNRLAESLTDP